MRSLKYLAVAGAVALGVSGTAFAADLPPPPAFEAPALRGSVSPSGLYLRGDIGIGIQNIGKYGQDDVASVNGTFNTPIHNNPVFVGAGIGYRINNWLRFDLTGEYRGKSGIGVNDNLSFQGFTTINQTNTYRGDLSSFVGMANAYVDLGTFCALGCLTPYVGAGVGLARNEISGVTDQGVQNFPLLGGTSSPTFGYAANNSKTNVAYALMAGVGYEINKNLTLELGYRYLNLGKAESGLIQNAFLAGQTSRPLKLRDIDSHDIKIGMRWNLNGGDCCNSAPEPVAYAPAPLAPRPTVRKY
jgi:opacity protein-like surface antigen